MTDFDDYYRGHRIDAMPAPDGTWRGYVDQYEVCDGAIRATAIRRARAWVDQAMAEQQERWARTAALLCCQTCEGTGRSRLWLQIPCFICRGSGRVGGVERPRPSVVVQSAEVIPFPARRSA